MKPRGLVLVPTRELANQVLAVVEPLARTAGLTVMTIFGGVGQNPQVRALRAGTDIVIACPGRLEDLVGQGHCDLGSVEITVLDEADHMADLGFLPGVRRLMDRTPKVGQRLLFSATLDRGVDVLVKRYLSNPVTHQVDPVETRSTDMVHHVFTVASGDKAAIVRDLASGRGRAVLFTRTKHQAKKLAKQLTESGIPAVDLHGNLSQSARERNLAAFTDGSQPRPGRHGHRRPWHPRGRGGPRGARRSAGRAQGLPASLGPHRSRGCRRHRRHDRHRGPVA